MKRLMKLLALAVGALMLANAAYAQSPREQLKQMVEELQKSPNDNALRERIIKFAQGLRPAPAVPDAAIQFEGRAQFAFKNAKSSDDYLAAAHEYEKAVANAPWVSGYYWDICTIYEKAGKLEDAKRNCEFSLIGVTDPAQITDLKRRIAGLGYGIEQNSPSAIAEREKAQEAERLRKLLASLEGGVWSMERYTVDNEYYFISSYEVHNGRLVGERTDFHRGVANKPWETGNAELKGNRATLTSKNLDGNCSPVTIQFSQDNETIEESYTCYGKAQVRKYFRKH